MKAMVNILAKPQPHLASHCQYISGGNQTPILGSDQLCLVHQVAQEPPVKQKVQHTANESP